MAAVTQARPVVLFDQEAAEIAPVRPGGRALVGHRLSAWLVDTGILLTLQVGAFLGLSSLLDRYDGFTADVIERYDVSRPFLDGVVAVTLLITVPLAYRVLFDRLWYGQTLGKYCFGLQVVRRSTGDVPNLGWCVAREVARIPSLLLGGLGYAIALVNRQRLTLCDLAAGTVVLPAEEAALRRRAIDEHLLNSGRVTVPAVRRTAARRSAVKRLTLSGAHGVLTIPNVVSVVRLCCVPLFLYLLFGRENRAAAAYLLGALGATDWLDGYIARHLDQVSTVGKVLDPTADRILLGVGIIAIMIDGSVPLWIGVLTIVREVLVSGAVVVLAALGARRIDVTWAGKAGTFALMVAFPLFLGSHADHLGWQDLAGFLAWVFVIPGMILSWYAAVAYVPRGLEAFREGRTGRPA
jgi:cardiolipin synthase